MAVGVGNGVGCGTVVGVASTTVGVAANGLAGMAGRLSQAAPRSGSTSMMKHADHRFILSAPTVSARRANSLPDCTGEQHLSVGSNFMPGSPAPRRLMYAAPVPLPLRQQRHA